MSEEQKILRDIFDKNLLSTDDADGSDLFTEEVLDRFIAYYKLLTEWNEKINLTAITEYKEVCFKHFLDSLSLAKTFSSFGEMVSYFLGKSLCDVGTGAGFPGIPLKIMIPELKVTLFDSLDKRVKFLDHVISVLDLKGIEAVHGRAEDLAHDTAYRECFDHSTARAVASLPVLCEYCIPFLKEGGSFIVYKSDVEEEIRNSSNALSVLGGEIVSRENFKLSYEDMTADRTILFVKKINSTPASYPRKAGKASKQPL